MIIMMNNDIQKAVRYLKQGKLVALPTETVYGLAGDASNPAAIQKIFEIKNRPRDKALLINIYDIADVQHWARDIPELFYKLAEKFWPGPLTFILESRQNTQPTIGLRMPSHPIAREVLKQFGGALVMPSANYSGHPSPINAEQVRADLGDKISLIVDGGETEFKLASTIVDLTQQSPRILREGAIPADIIENMYKAGNE